MSPPSYDLSLVAGQLLAAEKKIASLSAEEQLKKSSWRENQVPGQGGVLFWGILAVVVVVLLVIISRLVAEIAASGIVKIFAISICQKIRDFHASGHQQAAGRDRYP